MKIKTIAVIHNRNGILQDCSTFTTDKEGTQEAEKHFLGLVREEYTETDDMTPEEALDEGYWDSPNGTSIFISWT